VSIRKLGDPKLGTRAELKNINSFRFLERGINFEIQRQIELLESGGRVVQETRTYDSERDETRSMREKEESNDYRYFPDPDLLPLLVEPAFIAKIKSELPELPEAKRLRFLEEYGLNEAEAQYLTGSRELAEYFEALTRQTDGESKLAANWITSELAGALNSDGLGIEESRLSPEQLSGLLARIVDKTISGKIAKDVFNAMWAGEGEADQIISERGLQQITDSGELEALVDEVIEQNLSQVEQYLSGKEKVLGFFVGQIMKKSGGKANPGLVNKLLRIKLEQRR
jgi:aspartyl-tRNA(Asn)/glutamyl-tRNA(Gln) amidotransferase subunit B